jgi:hypothetical protein
MERGYQHPEEIMTRKQFWIITSLLASILVILVAAVMKRPNITADQRAAAVWAQALDDATNPVKIKQWADEHQRRLDAEKAKR